MGTWAVIGHYVYANADVDADADAYCPQPKKLKFLTTVEPNLMFPYIQ